MKRSVHILIAALAVLPLVVQAQEPPAPPEAPAPPSPAMPQAPPEPPMPGLAPRAPVVRVHPNMLFDQDSRMRVRVRGSNDESSYRRGMSYLDRRDYDHAIDAFNRLIEDKADRADGALYWRAYAENKLGKRDQALATLSELQKTYPQSRWIEDAKALQVEVRQANGQPVSPEEASGDDVKLLALNGLMNSDPDRTIPILEKLLRGPSSPRLKEHALFVLAQSRSPKARDLLAQVAKGSTNPDVQLKAIEYLGVNGSAENRQLLGDIYKSTSDNSIKRAILRSFMMAHDRDALLQAARRESNPDLRVDAIRELGTMGGAAELYGTESTFEGKREILRGLMTSGDTAKLVEIAKSEKDPKLRAEAINMLGVMGRSKSGDALAAMYRQETDPNVKRSIINALFVQGNAPAIVDIARKETDASLRKDAVSRLSVMKSKEATDYLMELLNK